MRLPHNYLLCTKEGEGFAWLTARLDCTRPDPELAALRVGRRQYTARWKTLRHKDLPSHRSDPEKSGCECNRPVVETAVYYLVIEKAGDDCWRRAGLAINVVAENCANQHNRMPFQGLKRTTVNLV